MAKLSQVFYPLSYRALTAREYIEEVGDLGWGMRDGEENRLQSFENHLEPWVDLYNKKREEQQSLCSSGEFMA